jgi:hypothetical protein
MHNANENVWGWEVDFSEAREKRGKGSKQWQDDQYMKIWSEEDIFDNWDKADKPYPGAANWFCRVIDRQPWFDDAKSKGGRPEMLGLQNGDKIIITCHGSVDEDYCTVHSEQKYTSDYGPNLRNYIALQGYYSNIEGNRSKHPTLEGPALI